MSRGIYQLYVNPFVTAWQERVAKEKDIEAGFTGFKNTNRSGFFSYEELFQQGSSGGQQSQQSRPQTSQRAPSRSGNMSRSGSQALVAAAAAALSGTGCEAVALSGSRPGTSRNFKMSSPDKGFDE
eukprot:gb/GFBE01067144.1/.p1 GENE.gb/GFBE01067144.1/~~gb/GFBE01067144.1/.p1  ORF type:complete len:126 (+),score=20.99 gb/GFBE01067144.1/:1-378(+)